MLIKTFTKVLLAFMALFTVCMPLTSKTANYPEFKVFDARGQYAVLAERLVTKNRALTHERAMAYVEEAYKAGAKWRVDPVLILAVMESESTFKSNARNASGASGLMQVIPRWHKDKIAGRNIFDYRVNIDVGAQILDEYLRWHKEDFTKALNRYRGGPSASYRAKIQRSHNQMRSAILEYKLVNDEPIIATYNFNQPRSYANSVERHYTQMAERHNQEFFKQFIYARLDVVG